MRHETELMRAILKSPKGQEAIDYVSPIYKDSYVGLWIFEAMGVIFDEIYDVVERMRYETNPGTSELLLDQWEDHYGIPRNSSLTIAKRQDRIIAKMLSRGPCNPVRLAAAVSSVLGGVEVDIQERTGKNKFLVNIREVVDDITPAVAILERMKPAHLIYDIRVATQMVSETDLKIAIAMTRAEYYKVEVQQ